MKRIEWVDFAKGIGIVLVVLGHTGPFGYGYCGHWINSFHMPLFFFLAGLCFDETRYASLWQYGKRKCLALLYPYVTLSLLMIGLSVALCWDASSLASTSSLWKRFTGWHRGLVPTVSPMGFLIELLFVELIYAVISTVIKRRGFRLAVCLALAGIGYWASFIVRPYEGADGTFFFALVTLTYYASAHFLKDRVSARPAVAPYRRGAWWLGVVWVAHAVLVAVVLREDICYRALSIAPDWAYLPISAIGIGGTILVSQLVSELPRMDRVVRFVSWLGQNTLVIFVLHPFLGMCRATWAKALGGGALVGGGTVVAEFAILALLTWALATKFSWIVKVRRRK